MSCQNVIPTFPRPEPGGTLQNPWPQGLSRSVPIPSTFGTFSQIVPVVPDEPYLGSQYTDAKANATQYIYTSTINGTNSNAPIQFRSDAERIRYKLGLYQIRNC